MVVGKLKRKKNHLNSLTHWRILKSLWSCLAFVSLFNLQWDYGFPKIVTRCHLRLCRIWITGKVPMTKSGNRAPVSSLGWRFLLEQSSCYLQYNIIWVYMDCHHKNTIGWMAYKWGTLKSQSFWIWLAWSHVGRLSVFGRIWFQAIVSPLYPFSIEG